MITNNGCWKEEVVHKVKYLMDIYLVNEFAVACIQNVLENPIYHIFQK